MKESIPELEALRLLLEQCRHVVVSDGQSAFSKANAKEARHQADRLDLLEKAEDSLDSFESALDSFPEVLKSMGSPAVPTAVRQISQTSIISPEALGERVSISSAVANATGFWDGHAFTVEAGSEMRFEELPSIHPWLQDHRRTLIAEGIVQREGDKFIFVQNAVFTSPSAAAGVIMGRSANGPREWKLPDGSSLGTLTAIIFGGRRE